MKARVKATGEILEIASDISYVNAKYFEKAYYLDELEWIDVKKDTIPDYWTRLEHQYAGMAMQGILNNPQIWRDWDEKGLISKDLEASGMAHYFAHALVEKLKEEMK